MFIELIPIRGTRTQGAFLDKEKPRQRTQVRVGSRKKGAPDPLTSLSPCDFSKGRSHTTENIVGYFSSPHSKHKVTLEKIKTSCILKVEQ